MLPTPRPFKSFKKLFNQCNVLLIQWPGMGVGCLLFKKKTVSRHNCISRIRYLHQVPLIFFNKVLFMLNHISINSNNILSHFTDSLRCPSSIFPQDWCEDKHLLESSYLTFFKEVFKVFWNSQCILSYRERHLRK